MSAEKNKDKYNSPFAKRLRELLNEENMSITALATKIGVTRQAVSQYQDGSTQPNAETIVKIAGVFNVSTDYLLGVTDIKTTDVEIRAISNSLGLGEAAIKQLQNFKLRADGIEDNPIKWLNQFVLSTLIADDDLYSVLDEVADTATIYVTTEIRSTNNRLTESDLSEYTQYVSKLSEKGYIVLQNKEYEEYKISQIMKQLDIILRGIYLEAKCKYVENLQAFIQLKAK